MNENATQSKRTARPKGRAVLAAAAVLILVGVAVVAYLHGWPARRITATGMLSNAGWMVTFHLGERATEVEYALPPGDRFVKIPEPPGGEPRSEAFVTIPGLRGRVPIQVRYRNFLGIRKGPYEVVLDTVEQAVSSVKRNLAMVPEWVSFRQHAGRRLCYFTHLVSQKYALREIRYGMGKDPDRTLSFVPGETGAIDKEDQILLDLEPGASFVTVELVFADGSRSGVRSFQVPFDNSARAAEEPWEVRPGQLMAPIKADDARNVDVVDLLSQAQALADRLQPGARLVSIHASEVVGGTVDVTKAAAARYSFEYEGFDTRQPPGKDEVRVAIDVSAGDGKLWAFTHGGAHRLRSDLGGKALEAPCPSRRAWEAAVKSGVPENAVASLTYEVGLAMKALRAGRLQRAAEWRLRVKGHDDLARSVDPRTCQILEKGR